MTAAGPTPPTAYFPNRFGAMPRHWRRRGGRRTSSGCPAAPRSSNTRRRTASGRPRPRPAMTGRKPMSRTPPSRVNERDKRRDQGSCDSERHPMIALIPRGFGVALAIYALAQFSPAFISSALACACCTNEGQRNVATVALDSGKRQEIESLRFAGKATIFTGEGDVDGIEGIATPAGTYKLAAKWVDDRLVLSFRDLSGHTGTLSLARPGTMSVFEVDPRDRPDKGHGPRLYKEWKLSA